MKKLIAFDLDDTLVVTKSPLSERMAEILRRLLDRYDVAVISGGKYEIFLENVVNPLAASNEQLSRLHLLPATGTRYYTHDSEANDWTLHYADDLDDASKEKIFQIVEESARELGIWQEVVDGVAIEDRQSQITYAVLGQTASAEAKYAWDKANNARRYELRDLIASRLPGFEVRVAGTTSTDITLEGIDKAYGMRRLIEHTGLVKEEILFVGDKLAEGGNDYPVKQFGIDTISVEKWEDTAFIIEGILGVS
jgi:phosphomannomutase